MATKTQIAATGEGSYPLYIKPRRISREQIAAARATVRKAKARARRQRLERLSRRASPPA